MESFIAVLGENLFQNNQTFSLEFLLVGLEGSCFIANLNQFFYFMWKNSDYVEEGYVNVIKLCGSGLTASCEMFWNDKLLAQQENLLIPDKQTALKSLILNRAGSFVVRSTTPIVVC